MADPDLAPENQLPLKRPPPPGNKLFKEFADSIIYPGSDEKDKEDPNWWDTPDTRYDPEATDDEKEWRIIRFLAKGPLSVSEIIAALWDVGMRGRVRNAIKALEAAGEISMTIPDKPRSSRQKRQLTLKGRTRFNQGIAEGWGDDTD